MAGWATTPSHCLVLPPRTIPGQPEAGIHHVVRSNSQSEVALHTHARSAGQSDIGILHARSVSQSDVGITLCQYGGQAGQHQQQQLVRGRKASPDEKEVGEVP